MGLLKTAIAMIQLTSEFNRYNSNIPAFEKLRAAGDDAAEQALILEKAQDFSHRLAQKFDISFDVRGKENIPDKGPIFVVANHQSFADVLAIYYIMDKYQIGFIAKAEFRAWKALANCIAYTRSVFIKRGNGRDTLNLIQEVADLMKRGYSFAIFPEGHRSLGKEMKDFKPGALKFAQKAGVPILPVSLEGGYKVFEIDNKFHSPTTIKVQFHPVVHIENMNRSEQISAFKQIEQTIRDGVEAMANEDK